MDKEGVNDLAWISSGMIGFNVVWTVLMTIGTIIMLITVVKEYLEYRVKRASLKRAVANVEEEPRHQGQVLDISENHTDEKQRVDSIEISSKQNKHYSLGGGSEEHKHTQEDIEDLETPSRGSEIQNYVDAGENSTSMTNKKSHIKIAVSEEAEKAAHRYQHHSYSDEEEDDNEGEENEEEEEEIIEMPTQKQGYAKMAKKNLQIEVIDYQDQDESPNKGSDNEQHNVESNEDENQSEGDEEGEHDDSDNKESDH